MNVLSKYYESRISLWLCPNYPQQSNHCDCGIMLICGVKDLVRNYLTWSFADTDMNYKRALVTSELLNGEIFTY